MKFASRFTVIVVSLALVAWAGLSGCGSAKREAKPEAQPAEAAPGAEGEKGFVGRTADKVKGAGKTVAVKVKGAGAVVADKVKDAGGAAADLVTGEGKDNAPKLDENISAIAKVEKLVPMDKGVEVRWAVDLKDRQVAKFWLPPAEAEVDYVLLLTNRNELGALDAKTGMARWWTNLEGVITGNPCFTKFSIFLVAQSHLICLETNSGEVAWRVRLPFAPAAGPAVAEEVKGKPIVHLAGLDCKIYAMELKKTVWPPKQGAGAVTRDDIEIDNYDLGILWRYPVYSQISGDIVYNDRQVFANDDKYNVYAIGSTETAVGKPTSTFIFRTQGPMTVGPTVVGPYVFVPSRDRNLYCLLKRDVSINWRYAAGALLEEPVYAMIDPFTHKTTVVLKAGAKGALMGFNDVDGKVNWEIPDGRAVVGLFSYPENVLEKRSLMVILGEDGSLSGRYALNGEEQWRLPVQGVGVYCTNTRNEFVYGAGYNKRVVFALQRRK